ncbi:MULTISPECIES: helix-turn-helix domain-containing protein [Deefgea]|uniref:Helix-turn-helix domain-containing protein n=1 Tax=Deefgea chitinilytica TaxID=570276 RepID=A0ABS2CAE6_9NEIS|nr:MULTISPECIES: helix-turn-helix transcriptional regulator [Deefgea]MBM5571111.1 helix-turn-helix domain-containing protein [Deefgea chitinilytica]MBM9888341.1 helix-turn-helix transcriptional regulator [Deefgea sp. CFH1-16]
MQIINRATSRLHTPEELEQQLGENLKRLRISKNWEQKVVAERAGIGLRTLRNLELGNGSSLNTLIKVLRVLGREGWLATIAPVATIDPLMLTREAQPRQRASKPRQKKTT